MEGHGKIKEATPAQDESTQMESPSITSSQEASLLDERDDAGGNTCTTDHRSEVTETQPSKDEGGPNDPPKGEDIRTPHQTGTRAPNKVGPPEKIGKLLPEKEQSDGQLEISHKRNRNRSRTSAQRRLARINRPPSETPPSVGRPQKMANKMAAPPAKPKIDAQGRESRDQRLIGTATKNSVAKKVEPPKPVPQGADNAAEGPNKVNGPILRAQKEQTANKTKTDEIDSLTQNRERGQIPAKPQPKGSYADAAKDGLLSMAIINAREDDGYTAVTPGQYQTLQQAITMHMLQTLGKEKGPPPTFEESRLTAGILKLRCTTESKGWLEHHIPKIQTKDLWPGAKLKVVEFNRIPKPFKYFVKVPGGISKTGEIFRLLELQNPGVKTDGWAIIRRDVNENRSTSLIVGVDFDSFHYIRGKNGQLFCGLGKAIFNIIKGSIPKATTISTHSRVTTSNPPEMQTEPISNTDGVESIEIDE